MKVAMFPKNATLARNGFYVFATACKLDESSNHITDIVKKENVSLQAIQLDFKGRSSFS